MHRKKYSRPLKPIKKSEVKVLDKSAEQKSKTHAAQILYQAIPHYPKVLQKRGVQGITVVQLYIDENHKASQFHVYQSSTSQKLDKEAILAAKKSKYQAQRSKKGAYVGSFHKLLFRFELSK